jgi:hypothetical protein
MSTYPEILAPCDLPPGFGGTRLFGLIFAALTRADLLRWEIAQGHHHVPPSALMKVNRFSESRGTLDADTGDSLRYDGW